MGTLKPGATYVYERDKGTVYSREIGADPSTREVVGWEYDPINGHKIDYDKRTPDGRPLHDYIMEDKLWGAIRRLTHKLSPRSSNSVREDNDHFEPPFALLQGHVRSNLDLFAVHQA